MSTPHIEHFVDERGNSIYRAEFEGSFLSKDEAKELAKYVSGILAENHRLRELVRDMNKWLWNGADCTECPFISECNLNVAFESDRHANICIGWREIHNRMHELGVDA